MGFDRYHNQDILVHELAHAVHLLGAEYVIPGFSLRLRQAYDSALAQGKWLNTYAAGNVREYFVSDHPACGMHSLYTT